MDIENINAILYLLVSLSRLSLVFSILLLVKRILLPSVISFPYPTASDKNVSVVLGGSYNPPHNGHLGMLKYLSQRYGKVYAVIGVNPNKKYEVTAEERANLLREMIEASTTITEKNIQVEGELNDS